MRLSAGFLLVAGSLLPACGLNQQGVPPNADTLDFPSSALVDPSAGLNMLFISGAIIWWNRVVRVRTRAGRATVPARRATSAAP